MKKRLQFARAHQNWTVEDWTNVAWSDESGFQMVESEFGVNRMRTWIHHALFPLCRLVVVV